MARIPQSDADLQGHLQDHLGFLSSSSDAFDAGQVGEAKRLAVSLRVLFHDTAQSHSLLGQLNRLGANFISSAIPHEVGNVATHGGLIMTAMSRTGSTYYAPLDGAAFSRWLPFAEWWSEPVFVDSQKATLTRGGLILAVANQDGGAHVDPRLSETYARLSRHNSMGWVQMPTAVPIPNPERAAIRQIAHETLKTLRAGYRKTSDVTADIFVGGVMAFDSPQTPPLPKSTKCRRNDPCPCGSGAKFKKCHGAI
jgi:hypothetical protein